MTTTKLGIKNLRASNGCVYFDFTDEKLVGSAVMPVTTSYCTNNDGQGLFLDDSTNKQIEGTCQFSLFNTKEKLKKNYYWIKKYFSIEF